MLVINRLHHTVDRKKLHRPESDQELPDLLLQEVQPGVVGSNHPQQIHRQAQARQDFLTQVPLLTSVEVGER